MDKTEISSTDFYDDSVSDFIPIDGLDSLEVEIDKHGGVQYLHSGLLQEASPNGDTKQGFEGGAPPSQEAVFEKGKEGGHSPSPVQKVLSCSDEVTHKTPSAVDTANREKKGGSKSPKDKVTANQLPALMPDYSDIVHREELKVAIESLPPFPPTIGGKAGWVACALNLVRKCGLTWEQWQDLNELSMGWVDIPESQVRHLIASFLKGYKLSEFYDITKGEVLVNTVFKATEKLAWNEPESEAVLWLRDSLEVTGTNAMSVTSADLLKAYRAHHVDDKRTDRELATMLKTSVPDAFPSEAREGIVKFSTHAKRYFRGEEQKTRARGWIALIWKQHMEPTVYSEELKAIEEENRLRAEERQQQQEDARNQLMNAMNASNRVFVDNENNIGWG